MKITVLFALGAVAALTLGAVNAQPAPPAKPAKVCSVYTDTWRDSIREGDGALAENCAAFAKTAKAQHYEIGCMSPEGVITFGAADGGKPASNCGW